MKNTCLNMLRNLIYLTKISSTYKLFTILEYTCTDKMEAIIGFVEASFRHYKYIYIKCKYIKDKFCSLIL